MMTMRKTTSLSFTMRKMKSKRPHPKPVPVMWVIFQFPVTS